MGMVKGQLKALPLNETAWRVSLNEVEGGKWMWIAYPTGPEPSELYMLPGIRSYRDRSEAKQAWLRFARKNNYIRYRITGDKND